MNQDLRTGISWTFWIPVAFVAALIVGAVMYYAVLPTLYNQETKAVRNSNQYITSKQTLMIALVDEYYELESEIAESDNPAVINGKKRQQAVIVIRVRSEASKLQAQYIPEIVNEFLEETK